MVDNVINNLNMPNALMPQQGLMSGGQPSYEDLQRLKNNGFTTIINLRPEAEMAGNPEAEQVAELGMNYHQIPVAGPQDFNLDNATSMHHIIDSTEGGVLVHCLSGNRVGALFAIRAKQILSQDLEQSMAEGRAFGLTKAEGMIRQILS